MTDGSLCKFKEVALRFYSMFSDSCNPLEKQNIYIYIIILKEETTKANSALKMESPKCHLLALKLRGSLCFFYTCSSQKTTDRASRIQGPIQCGCTIKRKNTHTHTRKYKTNAHELRQGYTVETLTHTHTHTWRGYKCMAVSLCFCTVTTLCGFKHFKCHLPPL